jgi:Plasmid encoded RepA protein
LSAEYFESLQEHGVPLDERALAALAHSPLALDVYAWLAQRLCRVHPNKPVFIPGRR